MYSCWFWKGSVKSILLIVQGSLKASHCRGWAALGGEMMALWYSCCKSEAVGWSGGLPRQQPRWGEKDLMKSSKDYKDLPAQQTRLCSTVKAFLTLMLWYLLPTRFAFYFPPRCLRPGLCVLRLDLRGRWHQTNIWSLTQTKLPLQDGRLAMECQWRLALRWVLW